MALPSLLSAHNALRIRKNFIVLPVPCRGIMPPVIRQPMPARPNLMDI